MKRKIITVLLLAACLPVFCTEVFRDGEYVVAVECAGQLSRAVVENHIEQTMNGTVSDPRFRPIRRIQKLSNRQYEIINNALSMFYPEKGEAYLITVGPDLGKKSHPQFILWVCITKANKQNYEFVVYGIQGAP